MWGQESGSTGPFWPRRYRLFLLFDHEYLENGKSQRLHIN